MDVETKYALLKENIKNYGKIAVAFYFAFLQASNLF